MTYDYLFENGIRIRIWEDEFPIEECIVVNTISKSYDCSVEGGNDKQIAVELKCPKNISNYGMLGVKYNTGSAEANCILNLNDYEEELYTDNISIKPDIVHKGIPEDYVEGILKSIEVNKDILLREGDYEFCIGAHGEVGSSEKLFFSLTNILFKLLECPIIDKEIVEEIVNSEILQK